VKAKEDTKLRVLTWNDPNSCTLYIKSSSLNSYSVKSCKNLDAQCEGSLSSLIVTELVYSMYQDLWIKLYSCVAIVFEVILVVSK
jgi:hypothetical protein